MQNKWATDILDTGGWALPRNREETNCKKQGGSQRVGHLLKKSFSSQSALPRLSQAVWVLGSKPCLSTCEAVDGRNIHTEIIVVTYEPATETSMSWTGFESAVSAFISINVVLSLLVKVKVKAKSVLPIVYYIPVAQ